VRKILRSGASSFEYERRIQLKRSIAGIAKGSGQPRQAWVSWGQKTSPQN
jgi:hypothetical protein